MKRLVKSIFIDGGYSSHRRIDAVAEQILVCCLIVLIFSQTRQCLALESACHVSAASDVTCCCEICLHLWEIFYVVHRPAHARFCWRVVVVFAAKSRSALRTHDGQKPCLVLVVAPLKGASTAGFSCSLRLSLTCAGGGDTCVVFVDEGIIS